MISETVEYLFRTIASTVAVVRSGIYSKDIPETLDGLWNIQDSLNRLVDVASDAPTTMSPVLDKKQFLWKEILDLLDSTRNVMP